MSVDTFLSALDKVKRKGKGQWIACCPAHDDKSPSMTIAELDDGRVLCHCFSGCSVEEILSAIGMGFDVLYPPKTENNNPKHPMAKPFLPSSVLEVLAFEALIVVTAARQMVNGEPLDENDYQRLFLAAERMQGAVNHVRA
jgi:CHC2 zinc finger